MNAVASQITGVSIVCSTVCSDADQRNIKAPRHWFCEGNLPVTGGFPHKGPITRKKFSFDDVIMNLARLGFSTQPCVTPYLPCPPPVSMVSAHHHRRGVCGTHAGIVANICRVFANTICTVSWHSCHDRHERDPLTCIIMGWPSGAKAGIFRAKLGQYHGCECPGSLRLQVISSHDTEYVQWGYSCVSLGRI